MKISPGVLRGNLKNSSGGVFFLKGFLNVIWNEFLEKRTLLEIAAKVFGEIPGKFLDYRVKSSWAILSGRNFSGSQVLFLIFLRQI